jgi:hypothetical protein
MKSDDTTKRVRLRFSATSSTRRRSLILAGVAAIGFACCPLFGSTTANAQQQQAPRADVVSDQYYDWLAKNA